MPSTTSTTNMGIAGLPFQSQVDGGATMAYTNASVETESLLIQGFGTFFSTTAGSPRTQSNYSGKYIRITGSYKTTA